MPKRKISKLSITPDLPGRLAPLWDLAYNLWWTWNHDTMRALKRIDPDTWLACERNPLRFLSALNQRQLSELSSDPRVTPVVADIVAQFQAYRARATWFQQTHGLDDLRVAYFSAEFGLTESLRIYSGGLGVLAGDHLKAASDLGLPLCGVGLMYRQGYFHQALNPDGWQAEFYPQSNFDHMPVRPVLTGDGQALTVTVAYPDGPVHARVWLAQVGSVPLYLLDANLEVNRPEDREITARLYGGDREMRIRQEMLLGIGGLRALETLGLSPTVCHMNEGHSAFLALERIHRLMDQRGLSFAAAREASVVGNVFTTHTPVAAGNDWFPPDLVSHYLRQLQTDLGLSEHELLALGRVNPDDHGSDFCMTVLALRLSSRANGVSQLHGHVSRRMWAGLWRDLDVHEVPITAITNGVHLQSWASPDIAELFDRHLTEDWRYAHRNGHVWSRVHDIPDEQLWATHQHRRQRLVEYARFHLRNQFSGQGLSPARVDQALQNLNSEALTIGFARRFATYKRGALLFRNLERLAALFASRERPLQVFFAGKAHPHDNPGKELIRQIVHLGRQEPFRGRIFFLQDYDMNVARYLVQGCDVWLNNPRRPQEASGTSGMKAALNGALNLSVLDGWWAEACSLHTGWTMGRGEEYDDSEYQDEVESNALYDLLESSVVPLFYDRDPQGLPRGWIARMKDTIASLAPVFNTNRMVRQYVEETYLPAHQDWVRLAAAPERPLNLAQWKDYVRRAWPRVRILAVQANPPEPLKVGARVPVQAHVQLGELLPEDVRAELYMGRLNAQEEIVDAETLPLQPLAPASDGVYVFAGEYPCSRPGSHGFTVRLVPQHPDVRDPLRLGLVCWSQEEE